MYLTPYQRPSTRAHHDQKSTSGQEDVGSITSVGPGVQRRQHHTAHPMPLRPNQSLGHSNVYQQATPQMQGNHPFDIALATYHQPQSLQNQVNNADLVVNTQSAAIDPNCYHHPSPRTDETTPSPSTPDLRVNTFPYPMLPTFPTPYQPYSSLPLNTNNTLSSWSFPAPRVASTSIANGFINEFSRAGWYSQSQKPNLDLSNALDRATFQRECKQFCGLDPSAPDTVIDDVLSTFENSRSQFSANSWNAPPVTDSANPTMPLQQLWHQDVSAQIYNPSDSQTTTYPVHSNPAGVPVSSRNPQSMYRVIHTGQDMQTQRSEELHKGAQQFSHLSSQAKELGSTHKPNVAGSYTDSDEVGTARSAAPQPHSSGNLEWSGQPVKLEFIEYEQVPLRSPTERRRVRNVKPYVDRRRASEYPIPSRNGLENGGYYHTRAPQDKEKPTVNGGVDRTERKKTSTTKRARKQPQQSSPRNPDPRIAYSNKSGRPLKSVVDPVDPMFLHVSLKDGDDIAAEQRRLEQRQLAELERSR